MDRLLSLSFLLACLCNLSAAATVANVTPRDAWMDQVVQGHNTQRALYGAPALTWNANLYQGTQDWANQCRFQHSGGNYGENLAVGTGDFTFDSGLKLWMDEAAKYDYNHPGFSPETGHFTQVVWKSTTSVACAIADCPAGTIFDQESHYLVCRYDPPGNFEGQFEENVGRHV
ncbi:hypothetical protein AMATHDRAFT_57585 [Amanita thiersii Skay4041]|uniref:SCP domain-containing protein n=1 Tax=Amanita thiersii Skay4041 TaxID=703135 RepID=A0A2A9NVB1_9AGAR|nr:hypothetical protein AMATHDRAFT_57585 [Amanita thiersii Skay4041]